MNLGPATLLRPRDLLVSLSPGGSGPLYIQVAEAILEAIRTGRIQPGQAVPGVRELAERLGVHRNTALAAVHELEAQGWLISRPRAGFFVRERPAAQRTPEPSQTRPAEGPGFDLPEGLRPITQNQNLVMDLTDGLADARLAPTEALARAYQRALRLKGPELLSASEFKGLKRLRVALASHVAQQRAIALDPEQLLLLRGTAMIVSLVAQALIGPQAGHVAVENPGHPLVWETLRQACGAELHPIPVDEGGLQVDPLEALLAHTPLHLLIVTPQCHYPTGVPLAPERRARILALAREHRFAILELDPEFDYLPGPTAPPRPLAAQDTTGQVLYGGSLSRLVAPGVRLTYLAVPPTLADRFAKARQRMDWQGDLVQEWAISELILEGEIHRHLRRVRKACLERRAALMDALRYSMGDRLALTPGPGGMGLWVQGIGKLEDPQRFLAWVRSCGMRGLKLRAGSHFDIEGRDAAFTRLGFTAYNPEELQAAVAMMG